MNTAMEAIDKLRDTAMSHERCSVIEVMGRKAGYLALNVGIACGAEVVMIPEVETDFTRDVVKVLLQGRNSGKHHYIVVVAEGAGTRPTSPPRSRPSRASSRARQSWGTCSAAAAPPTGTGPWPA
jgi:6-phosphofructokinase